MRKGVLYLRPVVFAREPKRPEFTRFPPPTLCFVFPVLGVAAVVEASPDPLLDLASMAAAAAAVAEAAAARGEMETPEAIPFEA